MKRRMGIRQPRSCPDVNTKWQLKEQDGTRYIYTVKSVYPKRIHMGVVKWLVNLNHIRSEELDVFLEKYTPASEEAFGLQTLRELVPPPSSK